jgi:hypothetical protein
MRELERMIPYFVELAATSGLIFAFAFISWTKIALGSVLTVIGAFFPNSTSDKATGTGSLKLAGVNITLRGSLRVGVLIAGLVLIVNEGISGKINSDKFSSATESASKNMEALANARDNKAAIDTLTPAKRTERLLELRDSLKTMQSIKPDPKLDDTLAALDKIFQEQSNANPAPK